ncbi:hypothetical protein D3C72_1632670 [compost metagenome]
MTAGHVDRVEMVVADLLDPREADDRRLVARHQAQFRQLRFAGFHRRFVTAEIHLVDGCPVDGRRHTFGCGEGDLMACVEQGLHRLHQFIEVESGFEYLAVLQIETIVIGQHDQDVSGMGA